MTDTVVEPPGMSDDSARWWLAIYAALGSVGLHMIIPALPMIAVGLDCGMKSAQSSLSLYLTTAALGQLVAASLSVHYGRRSTLVVGILCYAGGALICACAGSIDLLLAGRAIQGLGASSGMVIARASAADKGGERGIKELALLSGIILCSPLVGPVFGVIVIGFISWRASFLILAASAGICLVQIVRNYPSSLDKRRDLSVLNAISVLFRDRMFYMRLAQASIISSSIFFFWQALHFRSY